MRQYRVALIVGALMASRAAWAEDAPSDIAQWELTCYCAASVATPHFAVEADNNGRILARARAGITAGQLRADGLPVTDSQLYFLREYRLLEKNGEVWKTTFPVLGPDKMGELRKLLNREAGKLARKTSNDVRTISSALTEQGFADNAYSVIFSYVLDGLTWDRLNETKALRAIDITAEHPFWDGVFWAVYPKRVDVPGTNDISAGAARIRFTWTPDTLPLLSKMQSSAGMKAFLEALPAGKFDTTPLTMKEGGTWRLVSADGKLLVPLIHDKPGNSIADAGRRIAAAFVERIRDKDVLANIKAIVGTDSDSDAIIIAMHEFIWEALDAYVKSQALRPPATFHRAAVLTPDDMLKMTLVMLPE